MFHSILLRIGFGRIGSWLHAAASGDKGPEIAAFYQSLRGKKTITSIITGGIAAGLLCAGYVQAALYLALFVGAVLVPAGLVDSAWNSTPESASSYHWCIFLRDHWMTISSVLSAGAYYSTVCDPNVSALLAKIHLTCRIGVILAGFWTGFIGYLIGMAKLAPAPKGSGFVLQVLQPEAAK